ncbi:MAG: NAD(P)-dependent oxidoreductase [Candidatus Rokubacteria bacterium]|nr:NAD(P)-dependent oxidoreductase [Candidatus Rokubacteria bacterium]
MTDTVGFIGLGTMGGPMATNLARAGVPLVVHDASAAAVHALRAQSGVTPAASAREVAAKSAVLFTCLPNDAIVTHVYLGPDGIAAGGAAGLVTCDCSTVSPDTTLEVARALAARQITHMDTPMLGSQPQAVSGEIFFIVGGDRAKLPAIARYLDVMGRLHMHVGASAMANRVKLIHNGLAAVVSVAVAEALGVTVQSGVDPYVLYDVIRNGGGMAHGTYFERRVKRMLDGDFSPTFMAELMRKDVGLALDLARSANVPTPCLEETKRAYDAAVEGGWGREDFSAVTHVIEQRIGRKLSPNA